MSSIASSFFGSKEAESAAKAKIQIATVRAQQRTKRELGLAKQDTIAGAAWKKWTPVLVFGAVAIVGFLALASAAKKRAT